MTKRRPPIRTDRVRGINGQSFAFIPHRFLRDGFFASLSANERSLYFFFVLAGDRYGSSFYHYDTICSILEISLERYIESRNALIRKDLIAFDGSRTQVLSLPEHPTFSHSAPLTDEQDFKRHDPASVRQHLIDAFADDD